ncbi:hypothetical protein [Bacillus solitudinis]|uniref:hypothetical protein n=1 Tax=Bacillus solitudinis TaxID=2014074 RepID=UPI000C231AE3|nr:hypothetical protein [Bacillus solitudinis]
MEENQKAVERDVFSELMFGPPRTQANPPVENTEINEQIQEKIEEETPTSNQQISTEHLAQIISIVQTVGPVIQKLGPLVGVIQTFFTKQKEEAKDK